MKASQLALDALVAAKNGIEWWHDAYPQAASSADGEMLEQIKTAAKALEDEAGVPPVVAEWQARVGKNGRWTRIDPPRGKSVAERIKDLRSYTTTGGTPAYEIRALVVAEVPDPS